MEQKLSYEEIARVFAMYIGAPVRFEKNIEMTQFTADAFQIGLIEKGFDPHGAKLLLEPLSAISDEHAIEIANILFPLINLGEDAAKIYYGRTAIHFHLCNYSWDNEDVHDTGKSRIDISERIRPHLWIDAFDQLREWGYALPYKRKSLFDLGIAYDVTKQ